MTFVVIFHFWVNQELRVACQELEHSVFLPKIATDSQETQYARGRTEMLG